ncbi:hypothetical protein [Streptomyces sp. MN6]
MRRAASVAAEEVYQVVVGPLPVGSGVGEGFDGGVGRVGVCLTVAVAVGGAGEAVGRAVGVRVPVPGGGGMPGPGVVAVVRGAPGPVDGTAGVGADDRRGASRADVSGFCGAAVPVPVPAVEAGGGGTSPGPRLDGATPDVPATRGDSAPVLAPPSGTAGPVPVPWSGTPGGCVRPGPGGDGRVAGPPLGRAAPSLGRAAPPVRDTVGTGAPVPAEGVGSAVDGGEVVEVGVGSGPSVGRVRSWEADGLGLGVPSSCATHTHTPTPPRTSAAAPPAIHGARRGGRR